MKRYIPTIVSLIIAVVIIAIGYLYKTEPMVERVVVPEEQIKESVTTSPEQETHRVSKLTGRELIGSKELRKIESDPINSKIDFVLYEDEYKNISDGILPKGVSTTTVELRLQAEGSVDYIVATSTESRFCKFPEDGVSIKFSPLETYFVLTRGCYEGYVVQIFETFSGKEVLHDSGVSYFWDQDELILLKLAHQSSFSGPQQNEFYMSRAENFQNLQKVLVYGGEDEHINNVVLTDTSFTFDVDIYKDGVVSNTEHHEYNFVDNKLIR